MQLRTPAPQTHFYLSSPPALYSAFSFLSSPTPSPHTDYSLSLPVSTTFCLYFLFLLHTTVFSSGLSFATVYILADFSLSPYSSHPVFSLPAIPFCSLHSPFTSAYSSSLHQFSLSLFPSAYLFSSDNASFSGFSLPLPTLTLISLVSPCFYLLFLLVTASSSSPSLNFTSGYSFFFLSSLMPTPPSSFSSPMPTPTPFSSPMPTPPHSGFSSPMPTPPHSGFSSPMPTPPHSGFSSPMPTPPHSGFSSPMPTAYSFSLPLPPSLHFVLCSLLSFFLFSFLLPILFLSFLLPSFLFHLLSLFPYFFPFFNLTFLSFLALLSSLILPFFPSFF
ncbi:unnamed protein product [Acanthosepion pharaonis]|uniref:Uncharacterized protein n=1 Tax=Acanthosepion pharaonis TaxID=158019 RepID=A0A812CD99_ACAPH|nr:unnamed protein product [Sepia pharaonis]